MNDQKNTLLAIVLSALVLIVWQYFVGLPQLDKQRQETAQKQTQSQPAPETPSQSPQQPAGQPTPQAGGPQVPGQPAATAVQQTREVVIAGSPRIALETPRLKGSIALKGGRIDDLSLTQYRETVDPKSPAIVLLSPSGSPHPFYAEFGWVGGAG
jgi:YidC/Oxa1 family membrane protein insertase